MTDSSIYLPGPHDNHPDIDGYVLTNSLRFNKRFVESIIWIDGHGWVDTVNPRTVLQQLRVYKDGRREWHDVPTEEGE
jgi:hypothetical protein